MLYRYTGELTDSVAFDDQSYSFTPQGEIELPDDLVESPYIARMIQNGLLKAVSKAGKTEAAELSTAEQEAPEKPAPAVVDPPAPVAAETTAEAPVTEVK